ERWMYHLSYPYGYPARRGVAQCCVAGRLSGECGKHPPDCDYSYIAYCEAKEEMISIYGDFNVDDDVDNDTGEDEVVDDGVVVDDGGEVTDVVNDVGAGVADGGAGHVVVVEQIAGNNAVNPEDIPESEPEVVDVEAISSDTSQDE
ncbi:hypothetical protein MKW92_029236, partial [Papaver armeniacum]